MFIESPTAFTQELPRRATLKRRLIVARPEISHAMSDAKVYAAGFDNENVRRKREKKKERSAE